MDTFRVGLIALALCGCQATHNTQAAPAGTIKWLKTCPGDSEADLIDLSNVPELDSAPVANELESALAGAIVASVGAALVTNTLSHFSAKLSEAAQEKTVDSLHNGDAKLYSVRTSLDSGKSLSEQHQAALTNAGMVFGSRCLLVMSKGTSKAKDERQKSDYLDVLTKGYRSLDEYQGEKKLYEYLNTANVGETFPLVKPKVNGLTNSEIALKAVINEQFEGNNLPGLVAVLDVVPSPTLDSFRLESRFASVEHSIREKKRDIKKRDFTLSFTITNPGTATPISALIKYPEIKRGEPKTRYGEEATLIASGWKNYPTLTEAEQKQHDNFTNAVKTLRSSVNGWEGIVKKLQNDTIVRDANNTPDKSSNASVKIPIPPIGIKRISDLGGDTYNYCKTQTGTTMKDVLHDAKIQLKSIDTQKRILVSSSPGADASTESRKNHTLEIMSLELYESYWRACADYYTSRKQLESYANVTSNVFDRSLGVFDTNLEIKEFREREMLKFLGGVLGNETLQSDLSGLAKSKIGDAFGVNKNTDNAAFEAAMVEVNAAEAAHLDKPTNVTLTTLEAKKRAANRISRDQDRELPYPDVGFWSF